MMSSSSPNSNNSSVKQSKRGSINIWINRLRNNNSNSLDDCSSSVSSLSTPFLMDASSSFYSGEFPSDASFDLTLLEESDDDDNTNADSVVRPRNPDWRWDSDPNLPLQRDLGTTADTPVMPPTRSKSNGTTRRSSATATLSRLLLQQQRKNLLTISKRTQSLKSLLQKPRMPRRQLSDASNHHLSSQPENETKVEPDVTETTDTTENGAVMEACSNRKRSSFSERLRRFPMDLPTRKLPARAARIQRVTRPRKVVRGATCTTKNNNSGSSSERAGSSKLALLQIMPNKQR
ncbi:expressed unknown protein [Seminavis robusta]|uniref:Uncharacterized protein n=1 Tax=Seminavis robusta TaxID=568900 RepID=A0A9N8ECY4_9STRA|nr:expressed unknown protein [Seminavis robusta]|eukprot:Sro896_g217390.1 n/a (291) ;mRNA; f:31298-32170